MKSTFALTIRLLLILMTAGSAANWSSAQAVPRSEYPRPQFERAEWLNLNGQWSYTFDFSKSGLEKNYPDSQGFKDKIIVPFCPESKLSGVGYTDFIEAMWYQRKFEVPDVWNGKRVIIHFGAVDFQSDLYIDGKLVGSHWGGTSSFSYDITKYVTLGKQQNMVLSVKDNLRSGQQPGGKQCPALKSEGCSYTRTTGIWQTVWLEAAAINGIKDCFILPDLDNSRFVFQPRFYGVERGMKLRIKVLDGTNVVAEQEMAAADNIPCSVNLKTPKTWSPESPFLYDIIYQVVDKQNKVTDEVKGYAGMRKIHIEGNKLYLNNHPIFLRFVLDQGFYPDGIWTAPTDAALKQDIQFSMDAGFNGARLHQKVFEERFHYWADKLGYLTWGESSSWGISNNDIESARNFLSEWNEIVLRDRSYPSIIGWSPFNETGGGIQHNRLISDAFTTTKMIDPTRPVNDASGYFHVMPDMYTAHNYEQNPEELKKQLTPTKDSPVFNNNPKQAPYEGQPYFLDEYGGIKWVSGKAFAENTWGYGDGPKTLDEYYDRLEKLTDVILSTDYISGYCYTQLTDVEQEQNGIYNYNRTKKFDMSRIKKILERQPASFSTATTNSGEVLVGLRKLMDSYLRDPSICRGPDNSWYLTGTTNPPEGIQIWKSKDLISWQSLGIVWKPGSSPWHKPYIEQGRPLWAPEIHFLKGTFWLTYSMPGWSSKDPGYYDPKHSGCGLLKSTSGKPEGPYVDVQPNERIGDEIDASLFQDDDGSVYYLWHSGKIAKMKPDMSGLAESYHWLKPAVSDPDPGHHTGLCPIIFGKDSLTHIGYEGAFMFKVNGLYYLCGSDSGEGKRYSCYVSTSKNIFGPYSARYEALPYCGHNMLFQDQNKQWWSTFFGNDGIPWREQPGILPVTINSETGILSGKFD